MILRGILAALFVLMGSGCASATPSDPNLTCAFRHKVQSVGSLKKLPPDIQRALRATAGAMADRGEDFNATDVISKPAPFNRFIRGGVTSDYGFVWYEHGGIAYWKQVVLFERNPVPHILAEAHAVGGSDICVQADRLLDARHL